MFVPRPKQAEVLDYRRGMMGVAAVPGSGKTSTLSVLAASLLANTRLQAGQEILIVTLVNAAAGNFARQINEYVQRDGLLPGYGYRVRTLHSLAHDILRQRPGVAGLDEQFTILDEHSSKEILAETSAGWVRNNPDVAAAYLGAAHRDKPYYREQKWAETLRETANVFIRQAKDDMLSPSELQAKLPARADEQLPLAAICTEIYAEYERALDYRGAVDFQDLIRLALQVLQTDAGYLAALRRKWLYILEDEAQDSSRLQEEILRMLADEGGNWVRMGDPNQAIYETFTTASPRYLRDFINRAAGVQRRELPNSGRSTRSIQKLANALIRWSLAHPDARIRERQPLSEPYILSTPAGDPQPNPPDNPAGIVLYAQALSPSKEARLVTQSCKRWLEANPTQTAAILVPRNTRGTEMVALLRQLAVPYIENLNSTSRTRAVIGSLARILCYLADPKQSSRLAQAYEVWRRDERDEHAEDIARISAQLQRMKYVEDFVVPRGKDWLEEAAAQAADDSWRAHLEGFRVQVGSWLRAAELPIDQLLLSIAGDIFHEESDIASAYMVAQHLAQLSASQSFMRLPQFADELSAIASNRRRFARMATEDGHFDPDAHKGKVTVTTVHKAKGLEWDRVYLVSVNNYDYPSAESDDDYIGEKFFIRDNLDLNAEALAQLRALLQARKYNEGFASLNSRVHIATERLRLLYVGITRARKELTITWNTGRNGDKHEAKPLKALRAFWEAEMELDGAAGS